MRRCLEGRRCLWLPKAQLYSMCSTSILCGTELMHVQPGLSPLVPTAGWVVSVALLKQIGGPSLPEWVSQASGAAPGLQQRHQAVPAPTSASLRQENLDWPKNNLDWPKNNLALSISREDSVHPLSSCLPAGLCILKVDESSLHFDLNGFLSKVCQFFENTWVKFPFSIWKKRKMCTSKDAKGIQEMHRSSFQALWAAGSSEIVYSICFDIRVVLNCRVSQNNFD